MTARKPKKTAKKKKRKARKKKAIPVTVSLFKAFLGVFILTAISVGVAILMAYLIDMPEPHREVPVVSQTESVPAASETRKAPVKPDMTTPAAPPPQFEIYPQEKPVKLVDQKPPVRDGKVPLVAIIIDDLGYDRRIANAFLAIDAPFTIAILPGSPLQQYIAQKAHQKGLDIMLHQPMEPVEYPSVNPGPKALLSSMDADQLIRQLQDNIATTPHVKGINNHMGSRLTSDSGRMNQVFTVLKQNKLFFVDSRTTKDTRARSSAKLFQVRFAERDVFLDHKQDSEFIKNQFRVLVQTAHKNGAAIGIAHPYPITLEILKQTLPDLEKQVQLVPASRIVGPAASSG